VVAHDRRVQTASGVVLSNLNPPQSGRNLISEMTAAALKIAKKIRAWPLKDQSRILYLLIKSLEVPSGKISKKEIDQVWKSDRSWKAALKKRIEDHRSGKRIVPCWPI